MKRHSLESRRFHNAWTMRRGRMHRHLLALARYDSYNNNVRQTYGADMSHVKKTNAKTLKVWEQINNELARSKFQASSNCYAYPVSQHLTRPRRIFLRRCEQINNNRRLRWSIRQRARRGVYKSHTLLVFRHAVAFVDVAKRMQFQPPLHCQSLFHSAQQINATGGEACRQAEIAVASWRTVGKEDVHFRRYHVPLLRARRTTV